MTPLAKIIIYQLSNTRQLQKPNIALQDVLIHSVYTCSVQIGFFVDGIHEVNVVDPEGVFSLMDQGESE